MSSSTALAIDSLHGFELTADGQYLMLNSNQPQNIALHCSVMHELIAALSNAIGHSERIRQKGASVKFAMPCEAWEIGRESSSNPGSKPGSEAGSAENLVVSFRLPGGAELSFRLQPAQAVQMTEVLSVVTGLATVNRPGSMSMQ